MRHPELNRRKLLKVAIGGSAAAYVALPTRFNPRAAAQDLAFTGDIEFWDWEFAARQAEEDAIIADWEQRYPDINLSYQVAQYSDAETKLLTAASAGEGPPFANVHFNWRVDLQRAGVLVPYPADLFNYDELISTQYNRTAERQHLHLDLLVLLRPGLLQHRPARGRRHRPGRPSRAPGTSTFRCASSSPSGTATASPRPVGRFNHYYSREWLWTTMIYQQGGYLYSEDGTQALFNSEEGVRALQMIADVYLVHQLDSTDNLTMFDAFGAGCHGDLHLPRLHRLRLDRRGVPGPDLGHGRHPYFHRQPGAVLGPDGAGRGLLRLH